MTTLKERLLNHIHGGKQSARVLQTKEPKKVQRKNGSKKSKKKEG